MKKHILALLIIALLLPAIAACGNENGSNTEETTTDTTADTTAVA